MFKNGQGYELSWRQGAGYWLAGTTTARPRSGNRGHGVSQPFAPYPRSGAASNWLGLPNDGDEAVAARLARLERRDGCPVGASTAAVPCPGGGSGGRGGRTAGEDDISLLIRGLALYDQAGVDFLEVNESCPNTGAPDESREEQWAGLGSRLERIADGFLRRRRRPLPVIVKVSVDTDPALVPELLDRLVGLGFDGVDFGNTSTDYAALREAVAPPERRLYDLFTARFGGGVSGRPLRQRSLALVRAAAAHLADRPPAREFHVVRTGGVETGADLAASQAAGAPLSGWFTGYFEAFARHGLGVYRAVYEGVLRG